MNVDEADAMLRARYPAWFSDADVSIQDGWAEIVVTSFDELAAALTPGASFSVVQVKEKFAGLRVYWTRGIDPNALPVNVSTVQTLIAAAGERARVTCQRCGRPGAFRNIGGWGATLCDDDSTTFGQRHDRA